MAVCSYGWLCVAMCCYVAMCGKVWLSAGQGAPGVGTCEHVWMCGAQCVAMGGYVLLYVAKYR